MSRDELRDGYATVTEIDGAKVMLIRLGDEIRAVSAWCTHLRTLMGDQPVAEDGLVECPLHGAVFDSADGSLQLGPFCKSLPVYEVEVDSNGAIAITLHTDTENAPAPRTSSFGSWGAPRN
ncbi:Rieske (2Fe-2S) protein [Nocardia sp. X0981]